VEIVPGLHQIKTPMPRPELPYVFAYLFEGGDGITLFDSGFGTPEAMAALTAGLATRGHEPSDIRRLIISHAHPDHYGMAAWVKEQAPSCELVMLEQEWAWLRAREGTPEFVLCEDENLARFLNGLIIKNRGSKDDGIPEPETFLNNNSVLRKLKIALSLQADDLVAILKLNEFTLSKHELSALFRRPDHKNYRECLDQVLRNFLDGMEKHYRQKAVGGK